MEKEGVIKFKLEHQNEDIDKEIDVSQISAWRTIMYRMNLIGQNPDRYHGLGFGNISQKISKTDEFLISGTQTGGRQYLGKKDYCQILEADPLRNIIKSRGLVKPSSETLTHAAIYQQSSKIQCVIHGHCPEIWEQTLKLNIPYTAEDIEYGTPEMALAVSQTLKDTSSIQKSILCMLGHKDGIFTFGASIQDAALIMIEYLAHAFILDKS